MTSSDLRPHRTLGNSDLNLSAIGFGAWAIGGGDWSYAWGPQDDNDSIAAIHRALDLGINWIEPPPSTAWATLKRWSPAR